MPASHTVNTTHLVFCALTALYLSRQERFIDSPYAENIFLLRWLKQAQKQRRFPKSVADDIAMLIRLGQLQGIAGGLRQKLEALWQEAHLQALQRLARAVSILTEQGWENIVLTDEEWASVPPESKTIGPAFYVRRSALADGFAEDGALCHSIDFIVYGDNALFKRVLDSHQLATQQLATENIVTLTPQ